LSHAIGELVCGNPENNRLGEILLHLRRSIEALMESLSELSTKDPRRLTDYGPFLGRSLLEVVATVLCGRFDPVRLLIVRDVQERSDYDINKVWKVSLRWQGDVLAPKVENPTALGAEQLEYEKLSKALLGAHYDALLWQPALQRLAEFNTSNSGSYWLTEMLAKDPKGFIPERRERLGQLYSAFSKGIHHEFVVPPGSKLDGTTVVNLLTGALRHVAELAVVSHFVGHTPGTLSGSEALRLFLAVEGCEVVT